MKKVFIFLMAGFCILSFSWMVANAAEVTLAWDENDPVPDGYRLFVRHVDQPYDYTDRNWEVPGGTTNITVLNLNEGVTYAFVVRAFVGEQESGDSNEIIYTI